MTTENVTNTEPTLQQVMDTMTHGFGDVKSQIHELRKEMGDTHAFVVELREDMDAMEKRMDNVELQLRNVHGQMGGMHTHIYDMSRRMGALEVAVEDLREEVAAIGEAVSKDAETTLSHKLRIERLETTVF